MEVDKPTCSNCRFGMRTGHDTYQCHRYPKRPASLGSPWPLMGADEWCGEWQGTVK